LEVTPTISVLVLNHNSQEHLEHCFHSLLASDYPTDRLELVLVDNASTDGSVEFVHGHFPMVRVIRHQGNWVSSRGNNLAAARVESEVVVFLNNDMRVEPTWLRELVRPFERGSLVAAVGAKILNWDGTRIDFADAAMNFHGHGLQVGHGSRELDAFDRERPLLFVCGRAMAVRRDIFLDTGGFDEDFSACYEDTDLCWRLWVLGHEVWFAPHAIVYHQHHGNCDTVADAKRRVLYERNALLSVVKNYEDESLRRVLPVALFLLLKRAYLLSGIDPTDYHVERPASPVPGELVANVGAKVRQRRTCSQGDTEEVPQQVASTLLAASDVVTMLPRIMEKRRFIQSRRRRPDAEILPLFKSLFEVSHDDPAYEATQKELVHIFGLDEHFAQWARGESR
jgi:GT2 family glycosyltransferase